MFTFVITYVYLVKKKVKIMLKTVTYIKYLMEVLTNSIIDVCLFVTFSNEKVMIEL